MGITTKTDNPDPEFITKLLEHEREEFQAFGRLVATGFTQTFERWRQAEIQRPAAKDPHQTVEMLARATAIIGAQLLAGVVYLYYRASSPDQRKQLIENAMVHFEHHLKDTLEGMASSDGEEQNAG